MNKIMTISTLHLHAILGLRSCLTAARAEAMLDGQSIVIVDDVTDELITKLIKHEAMLVRAEDLAGGLPTIRAMKNDHRKPLPFRSIPVPKKIGNGKGRFK